MYPDAKHGNSLELGIQYQDFCQNVLQQYGLHFVCFTSKYDQFNIGESPQGVEVKLDQLCTTTRRLSIETHEKSKASVQKWRDSGIYRYDNTWCYVQGNYDVIFVFSVKHLRWQEQYGGHKTHETQTIRAFYLPFSLAYATAFLVVDDPNVLRSAKPQE